MATPDIPLEDQRRTWFARTAKIVLPVAIAGYFVTLFVHAELGLGKFLELPLVLASLLVAITLLERQERTLGSLATTVTALERRMTSLDQTVAGLTGTVAGLEAIVAGLSAAAGDRGASVTFYRDRQFYLATRNAVEQASNRVFVSYLRVRSPDRLGDAARQHIEACRAWARSSPDHHFRRVILGTGVLGTEPAEMSEFLAQELAATRAARAGGNRYNVRLLTRSLHAEEAVSVGLYDDDLVFVSYGADADRMIGFSIRSREIVKEYFEYYYEKLWGSATPIEECDLRPLGTSAPSR